ncbi:thioredoxin-dependent thiol peroxidase [Verrucomicrobium sp. BvORR106]|uniref:thioredoxin-dependent thiol peroxidase n=1 Tax=Verrucomicrobium sp. BvORR106 TaxID=1403819 RepID=UPI00056DAFF5|nr:thioredoxin-dependent thiol peroxidase [Verrucomicrobium sp. BvORR106]
MSKPLPGTPAPDFTAPIVGGGHASGEVITLSQLRDKPVVLYFYPKDNTPGCTTQACDVRDSWGRLKKLVHLLGVSPDSIKSHERFIKKHELPFPIVSDEQHEIVNAYGVWVEKSLYGRKYMGTERSTFVIGTDGLIKEVLEKVKPAGHVDQVLAALQRLD